MMVSRALKFPFLLDSPELNPTNKKKSQIFLDILLNFWFSYIVILPKIIIYYFQKSVQLPAPKNWIQFEDSKF